MNVIFRADASTAIGAGHVMRCLALAQTVQDNGGNAAFMAAEIPSALEARLKSEGFSIRRISAARGTAGDAEDVESMARTFGAQWVVLDGYCFGERYQRQIKDTGLNLLVIDDHAQNRAYHADVILDQNVSAREQQYCSRPVSAQLLLGPKYILLRREIRAAQVVSKVSEATASRLLITYGGSDSEDITTKTVLRLKRCMQSVDATVIVGPLNPFLSRITELNQEIPFKLLVDPINLPEIMAKTEIAIIAGGTSLWELLYFGSAVLSYSRNALQSAVLGELAKLGAVRHLGFVGATNGHNLPNQLWNISRDPNGRAKMCVAGRKLVDGEGTRRVLAAMTG